MFRLAASHLLSEFAQCVVGNLTDAETAGLKAAFRNRASGEDQAVHELLDGLRQEGCTVSPEGGPEEESIRTAALYDQDGAPIQMRFFTISPAAPDGLLNTIAILITISGIVGAPLTGGLSLASSAVSMGFLVWKNRKEETDPTRLRLYDAIGRVALRKARGVRPAEAPRSVKMGATQSELSAELGIPEEVARQALDVLVEKGVIGPSSSNGEVVFWYRV